MYIFYDKEITMTTVQAIRNRINEIGMGEPFTSTQFNALGTRAALDQTLSRFVKQGEIARISRGVFVRPKKSRYVGEVLPEPSKVAQAIASVHGETRSEEHTSELQSPVHLVCRLLLEKKKVNKLKRFLRDS